MSSRSSREVVSAVGFHPKLVVERQRIARQQRTVRTAISAVVESLENRLLMSTSLIYRFDYSPNPTDPTDSATSWGSGPPATHTHKYDHDTSGDSPDGYVRNNASGGGSFTLTLGGSGDKLAPGNYHVEATGYAMNDAAYTGTYQVSAGSASNGGDIGIPYDFLDIDHDQGTTICMGTYDTIDIPVTFSLDFDFAGGDSSINIVFSVSGLDNGPQSTATVGLGLDNVSLFSTDEPAQCSCGCVDPATGTSGSTAGDTGGNSGQGTGVSPGVGVSNRPATGASNGPSGDAPTNGNNTVNDNLKYLLQDGDYGILAVDSAASNRWFDSTVGGPDTFTERFGGHDQLVHDSGNKQYVLTAEDGSITTYYDFDSTINSKQRGRIKGTSNPDGTATTYNYNSSTHLLDDITSETVSGTVHTLESFAYTYDDNPDPGAASGAKVITSVTLRRQQWDTNLSQSFSSGNYATVRTTTYAYYGTSDSNGNAGDLKTVTVSDASSNVLDVTYYRYYISNTAPGYKGAIKYILLPASYARATAGLSGDPATKTDGQIADYADHYYEYDSSGRVTKHVAQGEGCSACSAGQGEYTYIYETNPETDLGYNSWFSRTIESLPDGNQNVMYYNAHGEQMLNVFQDLDSTVSISSITHSSGTATATTSSAHGYQVGDVVFISGASDQLYDGLVTITATPDSTSFNYVMTANPQNDATLSSGTSAKVIQQWGTFTQYDDQGKMMLTAKPSAVDLPNNLTTLETSSDLRALNTSDGEIDLTGYYAMTTAGESTAGGVADHLLGNMLLHGISDGQKSITSQSFSGTNATLTVTGHGYSNGDVVWISGADKSIYDGAFIISNVSSNTFDINLPSSTGTSAGSLTVTKPTLLDLEKYFSHTNSTSLDVYPLASQTQFASANQTGGRTTTYAYTWYSTSTQMETEEVTRPSIASSQNGNGDSETDTTFYDELGRPIWTKDAVGVVSYTAYDPFSGAVVKTISDVAYASLSGAEQSSFGTTGWSHPSGGLHLVTTTQVDSMGRPTKITDPKENANSGTGNITYFVYDDVNHAVRTFPGWHSYASGSNTLYTTLGPASLSREDRAGSYTEELTFTPTPGTNSTPILETIDKSQITSLSRSHTSAGGQNDSSIRFISLSGISSYSTGSGSYYLGGSAGTNYYESTFGYDDRGRVNRIINAVGTITDSIYDGLGRLVSTWVGTDDVPSSDVNGDGSTNYEDFLDPVSDGQSIPTGVNMVKVSENLYDTYDPAIAVSGDSNLTRTTLFPTGTNGARTTDFYYDWRSRQVASKAGVLLNGSNQENPSGETSTNSATVNRLISYSIYDNLDEVIEQDLYAGDGAVMLTSNAPTDSLGGSADGIIDAPGTNRLRARTTMDYDDQGRVWQSKVFDVNQSTGALVTGLSGTNTVNISLKTWNWYDHRGNVIKTAAPGGLVTKNAFDDVNRLTVQYSTDGGGDDEPGTTYTWSKANELTGDAVFQQVESTYDEDSNVIFSTTRMRFHDAAAPGSNSGDLALSPASGSARVSYQAFYYDRTNRLTDSVDVGTNGGSSYSRPSSAPSRSDTVLVDSYAYNDAGEVETETDSRSKQSKTYYDLAGRTTQTIADYVDGVAANADDDQITDYTYDGNDNILTMKAVVNNSGTNNVFQTTQYVYGVVAGTNATDSNLTSNDLLKKIEYPDQTTGNASTNSANVESFSYNAAGDRKTLSDRNGNVHSYNYDALGRLILDGVTNLGSGVDGTVQGISYTYDSAGRPFQLTSHCCASGSGLTLSQIQYDYNGYGDLITEYQDHSGAVCTGSSPKVQYTYSEGGVSDGATGNNDRLTAIIYPNGRIVRYEYGTSGGLDDKTSRLSFIADDSSGSVGAHIEDYEYLGLSTVVIRNRPNANSKLTLVKLSGESNGDGGDQYTGLDRFGRIIDQRWLSQSGSSTATIDEFAYAYDRNSNPLYKQNKVDGSFSELYHANGTNSGYDGLNRLTAMTRGTLSDSNSDGVYDTVSTPNTLGGSAKTWNLDAVGNWNSSTSAAGTNTATTTTRTNNKQNEVTIVGGNCLSYDNAGSVLIDESGKHYTYDAWNRMVEVWNYACCGCCSCVHTTLESRYYDAAGRLITQGGTDLYYSNQWQVLEERETNVPTNQYVWSPTYVDELIERDSNADTALDGTLDTSFDTDGKLTTNFGGSDVAQAVAIQSDGKTLVAGNSGLDFAIARYNIDGSLDTTFDTDGKQTTDINSSSVDFAEAMAIQSDGKILVAGSSLAGTASTMALVRYTADGALDTTFGTGGKATISFNNNETAYGVAVQSDGKIILGGYTDSTGAGYQFALARLNSDGSLDTSFGTGGKTTAGLSGSMTDLDYAMALQPDGEIVLAGSVTFSDKDFAVARFTSNGALDTTFDTDGFQTTDFGGDDSVSDLAIQADGKIVVAGLDGAGDFAIARYTTSGALDTTFDTDGKQTIDFGSTDSASAIRIQSDGKIIVAGSSAGNAAVARLTTAGALDTTFDTDGKLTTDFGGTDTANALVIGPDYKITVVGASSNDFAVERIKVSNSLEQRLYATTDANHNVTSIDDVFGAVKERFVYDPYRNSTVLTSAFASTSDGYSWTVRSQGEREDTVTNTIDGRSRIYGLGVDRWMQADFAGYVDGANRYQMELSNPGNNLDPLGTYPRGFQGPRPGNAKPNSAPVELARLKRVYENYVEAVKGMHATAEDANQYCCNDPEAKAMLATAKDTALAANTLITTGLAAATASRFMGAKNLLVPWVRTQVTAVGNTLTVIGLLFETKNLGDAILQGDGNEILSSGATFAGSIWGFWNPYAAVATGAASLGKVVINEHYQSEIDDTIAAANAAMCAASKKSFKKWDNEEKSLRPEVREILSKINALELQLSPKK